MLIRTDDLSGPEIRALLEEHLRHMHELSPPESVHALDLGKLRRPDITFWTAWSGSELLGCGALRELDPRHGEVKSMRSAAAHRRRGAGRAMLEHILRGGARAVRELRLRLLPALRRLRRGPLQRVHDEGAVAAAPRRRLPLRPHAAPSR